jgi:hypothetical protein
LSRGGSEGGAQCAGLATLDDDFDVLGDDDVEAEMVSTEPNYRYQKK